LGGTNLTPINPISIRVNNQVEYSFDGTNIERGILKFDFVMLPDGHSFFLWHWKYLKGYSAEVLIQ
jgi:hypothetical protein